MNEEVFPLVDESGVVVGQAPRGICHNGSKLLHPVIHLHVFNEKGELLLQKRSDDKDIQPGKWDTAVGGHIGLNESVEQALVREAREELGIYGFEPVLIRKYVFESEIEKELVYSFQTCYEGPFRIDPVELSDARFWLISEIEQQLGTGVFTPNFEYEYRLGIYRS